MLDNKGNILLLPSPLKMGFWKKAGQFLFGDNEDRNEAKEKMKGLEPALTEMQSKLSDMAVSNPFENTTNAFAGMTNSYVGVGNAYAGADNAYDTATNAYTGATNAYSGAANVYDQAENVYEGKMDNAFAGQSNAYAGMKNQMEGMENAFEDLTVNTQQAEFEAQQNQQMQANIMSQMSGAAGGSGIAALAQSMANQGALQAQKASASIGAQESANMSKAAEAEQAINMKTADEGSRIAMAQAGEQSRLDTQKNQAEMDIQNKVLGADEALQSQKLGEASKLQMAEMGETSKLQQMELGEEAQMQRDRLGEASRLQMAEMDAAQNLAMTSAGADIDIQGQIASGQQALDRDKATGAMWEADTNIGLEKTAMDLERDKYSVAAAEASAPKDRGLFGNLFSDERLKENIIKIGTSHNHIPLYKFNYIGDKTTYVGTMAQDLIKLGMDDVVGTRDGFYTVNYDLIDVDMIKLPSPLKQLQGKDKEKASKDKQMQSEGTMKAGMDILSEAQKRKNWEELQKLARASEPEQTQKRKNKDRILRKNQRDLLGPKGIIQAPGIEGVGNNRAYMKGLTSECKRFQDLLYKAIQEDDKETEQEVNTSIASIKRMTDKYRQATQDFMEDHFAPSSSLSKGVSQQKLSIATQLYCQNPDANIIFAEKRDVERGRVDYYGKTLMEGGAYGVCYDFEGRPILVNVLEGNKEMWIADLEKAIEYVGFLNEINEGASKSAAKQEVVDIKPILGKINYKMDLLFGNNDGTATLKQNQIVMQFCWDESILRDGSSFRRHLYEHPNIQNLNYGGFDWDAMEFNRPLGEGDIGYWTDNIDELDQIALVDAITNQDHDFFDIDLLRTLIKEYYAYKIENAWWKGMGFDEGKLTVMRLKQNELIKIRFEKDKAKAASDGQVDFTFDGKVYPTGLDVEQVKKEEAIQNKKMKEGIAKVKGQKPNIQ